MSAPIEAGACYRDPSDGEIVRALSARRHTTWLCRVVASGVDANTRSDVGSEGPRSLRGWERVPDPTPAVVDGEPAHDEAARQERIDATARALFARDDAAYGDDAYEAADMLEAARERYIAARKGGAK